MKFLITLVALIVTNCLLAQDPYPRYAIDLNALDENIKSIKQNYSFYSCSVNRIKYNPECLGQEEQINAFKHYTVSESNYVYVPLFSTDGNDDDISILKIVKGDKTMTIYMSLSRQISYSDVLYLQNFQFSPETYFIELNPSHEFNNNLESRENGPGDRGVIVDFSKQKKVSEKELKKLIAQHTK